MFPTFNLTDDHCAPLNLSKTHTNRNAEKWSTYEYYGGNGHYPQNTSHHGYGEYEMSFINQTKPHNEVPTQFSVAASQFSEQRCQYLGASDCSTAFSHIQSKSQPESQYPVQLSQYEYAGASNNSIALSHNQSYNKTWTYHSQNTDFTEGMAGSQSNHAINQFYWNNSNVAPMQSIHENHSSNSSSFNIYANVTYTKQQYASAGDLNDIGTCSPMNNIDMEATNISLSCSQYSEPIQRIHEEFSSVIANCSTNSGFSNHRNDYISVKPQSVSSGYASDSSSCNIAVISTNPQFACSEYTKPVQRIHERLPSAVEPSNSSPDNHTNGIISKTRQAVNSEYPNHGKSTSPNYKIRMTTTNSKFACFPVASNNSFASVNNTDMANEMIREAFHCGREPRLAKYDFMMDETQTNDFAVENWSIPRPVIRISKSKFSSIFYHHESKVRRFKAPTKPRDPESILKDRHVRLQARIAAATTELEYFILLNMTRRKAMLLNQYQAYNKVLRKAAEKLENKPE